jgi:hypothetical protein
MFLSAETTDLGGVDGELQPLTGEEDIECSG